MLIINMVIRTRLLSLKDIYYLLCVIENKYKINLKFQKAKFTLIIFVNNFLSNHLNFQTLCIVTKKYE